MNFGTQRINEEQLGLSQEAAANGYFKKYKRYVETLESKSTLSKVRDIDVSDIISLGEQLDQVAWLENFSKNNEATSLNDIGIIPNISLDIVSAVFNMTPMNVIASVQPMQEESGIVYFRRAEAQTTKGNITSGDTVINPRALSTTPSGFASNAISSESITTLTDGTTAYSGTLANLPVRKFKLVVSVTVSGTTFTATDFNGDGLLLGTGLDGTINYITGAVTIRLTTAPDSTNVGNAITASYQVDCDDSTDITTVDSSIDSVTVTAEKYTLKTVVGMFASFQMQKRHGQDLGKLQAEDLVSAINKELMGTAIARLIADSTGNVNFDQTAPSGVSRTEHLQGFKISVADSAAILRGNAGRGGISAHLAGSNATVIFESNLKFKSIGNGKSNLGPTVVGTLDGVPVITVADTSVLGTNAVINVYKGSHPFDAALVHAPYMPLFITRGMSTGTNPLTTQQAAGTWAAIKVLVPNFITGMTITTS